MTSKIGFSAGPSFGRTQFDLLIEHVWDLKVHPENASSRMILNDQEAVDSCIEAWGGFGFVVVVGNAEYDESGAFKAWHDVLKGGTSKYEKDRVERGAPSRRRKIAFAPTGIKALYFSSRSDLERGLNERWISLFQTGMRNSNGNPRRAKYQIDLGKTPAEFVVADKALTR